MTSPRIYCVKNFFESNLDKELVFDVKMTIMEVYDSECIVLPEEKWIEHN